MSLADDLEEAEVVRPPSGSCAVCWHLDRIPAGRDRDALLAALARADDVSAGKIAAVMTKNGHQTSKSGVVRHRKHSRQEPTTA